VGSENTPMIIDTKTTDWIL